MEYAIINVPAAPVRRRPMHQKEMVNQLLFGESVKVIREKNARWVKVCSLHDNYEGWMTTSMLESVDASSANQMSEYTCMDILNDITVAGMKMKIPYGSSLPFFKECKGKIGASEYIFGGNYSKRDEQVPSEELVKQLAMSWLNAPYLWGGRTPLGVDCSGFVQVIYKMMGIDLPRDAWQQAQEGEPVKKFRDAKAGDLVFFDKGEEIVHVGIMVGENQVIHASGKVKVDAIDKKGVNHPETGNRILRLRAIRRMWRRI
ncbi:MAG TPA: C40 family peptidase [Chitinophagaceae bacterium]|nr:C40 family peptidase [Chitinophagaceae bacterium]